MYIVILSDFETQYGGAATGASLLASGLIDAGHQVTRIVTSPDGRQHSWNTLVLAPSLLTWGALQRLPNPISRPYAEREHTRNLRNHLDKIKPDIISVHNLHGALHNGWGLSLLEICLEYAPIVWTLHDMWSFTGRCAHSFECQKYLYGCDHTCPTADEYPALAPGNIARGWNKKKKFFEEYSGIVAVSPSSWLAGLAKSSFWRGHRVEVIPNGIPLNIYRPVARRIAREALGIDTPGLVVLLVGTRINQPSKGGEIVVQALEKLTAGSFKLLTMGSAPPKFQREDIIVHQLGYIDNEFVKAFAYSAADIYLHPSLADNLPYAVIESLGCGTPVVGFAVGGVTELVRSGVTGWLVDRVSPEMLADKLQEALLQISNGMDLSNSCRQVVDAEYNMELQITRYLELFKSLI